MNHSKPKFYEITNQADKAVDIRIYGSIPSWDWDKGDTNTAEQFVSEFKNLEKEYDRINIHINSPGGNLLEGFAMFNAIASSTADVHTYNDGVAFSLGGLLLFAGKTVHASQHSLTLIHNTQGYASGDAQALRDTADIMDKFDDIIAGILSNKSGLSKKQVAKNWLAYKDTVLTAEEALQIGLVDVLENTKAEISQEIKNLYNAKHFSNESALPKFYNPINQVNTEEKDKELKGFFEVLKNFFSPAQKETKVETPALSIEQTPEFQNLKGTLENISKELEAIKAKNQALELQNKDLEKKVNEYGSQPGEKPTSPISSQEQHAGNLSDEDRFKNEPWNNPTLSYNQSIDTGRVAKRVTDESDAKIRRIK